MCMYLCTHMYGKESSDFIAVMERCYISNESAGGTLSEGQTWSNSSIWKTA